VLDPPVDLITRFGRAIGGMAAVFSDSNASLIRQRTRDGALSGSTWRRHPLGGGRRQ
jgi:hypothetical protein